MHQNQTILYKNGRRLHCLYVMFSLIILYTTQDASVLIIDNTVFVIIIKICQSQLTMDSKFGKLVEWKWQQYNDYR